MRYFRNVQPETFKSDLFSTTQLRAHKYQRNFSRLPLAVQNKMNKPRMNKGEELPASREVYFISSCLHYTKSRNFISNNEDGHVPMNGVGHSAHLLHRPETKQSGAVTTPKLCAQWASRNLPSTGDDRLMMKAVSTSET
jgi:hypothetical protein